MTVSNASTYLFTPVVDVSESYTSNAANQHTQVRRGPVLRFPIGYDLAGNLVSDGANLFGYDSQNRLVSADMAAGSVSASYAYGPENRRYRKTVNGSVTSYAYDGGEAIAEYDGFGGSATLLRRYVYGPGIDEPVVKIEYNSGGTEVSRLFYHADHQGSVIALSTPSGTLSEAFVYSAYGDTADSLSGNPYRYTGRRLDEETGLYYYRARYYSPAIGRFLSVDPIGYGDGLNLYAYVGNDPVNFIDPSGLAANKIAEGSSRAWRIFNPPSPDSDRRLILAGVGEGLICQGLVGGCNDLGLARETGGPPLSPEENLARFRALAEDGRQTVEAVGTALTLIPVVRGVSVAGSVSTTTIVSAGRATYTGLVKTIPAQAAALQRVGVSELAAARFAHGLRNNLKRIFQAFTPAAKRAEIQARNTKLYGNPTGPSFERLVRDGKSAQAIIQAAGRTGGKDLGF